MQGRGRARRGKGILPGEGMNIFAYTDQTPTYPEYLSINVRNGNVEVSVRSPARPPTELSPWPDTGDLAKMTLPDDQIQPLIDQLQALLVLRERSPAKLVARRRRYQDANVTHKCARSARGAARP
jgi:hypothetical protein